MSGNTDQQTEGIGRSEGGAKRRVQIEMDVPQSLSERADGVVEAVIEKDLDILYRGDLSLHARCLDTTSVEANDDE